MVIENGELRLLLSILLVCVASVRQMCEEMATRYPAATLQDVYKTCYQDYFGAEHMISDTAAVRNYLHYELQSCAGTDLQAMPLREPTGFRHHYVRMNLSAVHTGLMTEDELLQLFLEAAGKPAGGKYKSHPSWKDADLQDLLREAARRNAAVHHSEPFRNTYNPHYRIIKNPQ